MPSKIIFWVKLLHTEIFAKTYFLLDEFFVGKRRILMDCFIKDSSLTLKMTNKKKQGFAKVSGCLNDCVLLFVFRRLPRHFTARNDGNFLDIETFAKLVILNFSQKSEESHSLFDKDFSLSLRSRSK